MVNKKIVYGVTIIAIIVVAIIIILSISSENRDSYTISNEIVQNVNNSSNSSTKSIKEENVVEKNIVNNITTTNEIENVVEENISTKSNEDRAKELAQKEWGVDDTVYYRVEKKLSEDLYIISVRNVETTVTLINYEVNLKTEKVEEY